VIEIFFAELICLS